ncbi:hypothetical protein FSP39_012298 [Pinctada imbricata]|uniref:Dipeptidase n=1 Tax=Pinctada imbricata TaxID=66713 RepID=A0AA89C4H5_PINIB|nr:hypothetical protein FSP39_012298 [Pinctada imbricata]
MSLEMDTSSSSQLTKDRNQGIKFRKSPKLYENRFGIGVLVVLLFAITLGLGIGIPLSKRSSGDGSGTTGPQTALQRAQTLLSNNPLIDGHNDLPWQYRQYAKNKVYTVDLSQDTRLQWNESVPMTDNVFPRIPAQTDIPRLRQGKLAAVFWAVFVSCGSTQKDAVRQGFDQVDVIHKYVEKYPTTFDLVTTAAGIENSFANGKIASLIGLEGGHMIGSTLGLLRMYYQLGCRYMTLTHSCDTPWAGNYKTDLADPPVTKGLSEFGKIVVKEMNRLGMIIDLSHTGIDTQKDALMTTQAPVIFSHSSAYTLCNHYRNVNDEILNMTRVNGGLVMVNFYTGYINCFPSNQTTPTLSQVVDHIEYIKDYIGIDYVGIGADYDGVDLLPVGVEDVSTYPKVFEELIKRGWSDADLIKLAGGNFLRVFKENERIRDTLANDSPFEDIIDQSQIPFLNCTTSF